MIELTSTTACELHRQQRYLLSESLERFLRSKYLEQPDATPLRPLGFRAQIGSRRPGLRAAARKTGRRIVLALTLVLLGTVALEGQAHASPILTETGVFVGQTAAQYSLNVASAGTLSVNLIDYAWPSPLADLTLQIASPTQILGQISGAGEDTLSLTAPGTYYAYVTGTATGSFGLGAYGLVANFQALTTPVPLPASISLLLGGIAATLWSVRRKDRTRHDLGLAGTAG